jgi:predicted metal-dependent peptidase
MSDKDLNQMLSKCKINLMTRRDSIFITTVLFSLKHSWDKNMPTAATDGINLFISPDFFRGLSFEERIFLLAHETWHVCFQHMTRLSGRQPKRWNHAADYVINLMLQDSGFKLINGALVDNKYRGMTAEQVYALLPEMDETTPDAHSDILPPQAGTTQEEVQQAIDGILARASIQTTAQHGEVPGDVERYLDKLRKPKVDWRKVLRNQMSAISREDYSMRRPNKRFLQSGVYIPGLYSESMGEIACAVDTSGSVSEDEFLAFISEISHIKTIQKPSKLTIIDFDTSIKNVYEFEKDQAIKDLNFRGCGGTNMFPVFDYYSGRKSPKVLLVFSDMYCDMSMPKPPYPVIWICVNRGDWTHEWGKVVHYDTSE